jgi:hypothetical protein
MFHVAAGGKLHADKQLIWRPCPECHKASKHHILKFGFLLLVRLNLGFITEGRLAAVLIIPSSWGSQRALLTSHQRVFWHHCRGGRRLLQGESLMHNLLLCFCFALLYFCLHRFIKNIKKLVSFIVAFIYLLLVLLEWVLLKTLSCVILLAPKTMILSALLLRHLLLRQIFMRSNLLC